MTMEEEEVWQAPAWLYPCILGATALLLFYRARNVSQEKGFMLSANSLPASFIAFQRLFLSIFFLASVAEGLQFVYGEALYASKGLKRPDIASLLAASYVSSLCLGTLLGIASDYIGRKRSCYLYGILQLMSSVAKQSNKQSALWFGNILQGVATSLYVCVFETWMTSEHEKLGFRHEWLCDTFWVMSFGGAVAAVASGALANLLIRWQPLGMTAPATAAAFISIILVVGVAYMWEENSCASQPSLWRVFIKAFKSLGEKRTLLLGWTQACFDFAVCVFWFLWTPTLVADGRELHSGTIYPCLMASLMLGTVFAAILLCGPLYERPENYLRYVFCAAAFCLAIPAYDYQEIGVLVAAFSTFHICSGIVWPSLARVRSIYIPNENRAGVISLFRVPFNAAIVFILIHGGIQQQLENSTIFTLSVLGLLSGIYCLHTLNRWRWQSHEKLLTDRP